MSVIKGSYRNYVNMYEFETELPGSGETITFKPVTTGQLKRLLLYETSNDAISMENALDDLITECVVKPENFDIKNLYLQDRFYLLVDIRKATRGATYNFQTTCTSCGSQTQHILDLSALPVTKLKKSVETQPIQLVEKKKIITKKKAGLIEKTEVVENVPVPMKETSEWNIVKLNDNISLRMALITRDTQKKAFKLFEEKYKDRDVSDIERTLELTTNLYALSITSIITPEGEETDLPLEEKMFLLDNIQQAEHEKISEWFDKYDFGIDFSFDVVCAQCHYAEKKAVPVENFFY